VSDSAFHQVKTAPRQFTNPRLLNGHRPFNVQALNGHIFVTYDSVTPPPASKEPARMPASGTSAASTAT
jgi:hypothetical protein